MKNAQVEKARSILLSFPGFSFSPQKDPAILATLEEAAKVWRTEGRYLNAAFAMTEAVETAWGNGDEVDRCVRQSLEDYQACISAESPRSHEALAAFAKLHAVLRMWTIGSPQAAALIKQYEQEFAQRIIEIAQGSPHCGVYLVSGVIVASDFDRPWVAVLPGESFPSSSNTPTGSSVKHTFGSVSEGFASGNVWIRLPSAFSLLLRVGDYNSAYRIVEQYPDLFHAVSMAGWPPALRGLLRLADRSVAFNEAATLFDADTPPTSDELVKRGGSWSGANQLIWAKYFRALAALERAKSNPSKATEFVAEASLALKGTESGLVNPQVVRLAIVVRALAGIVGVEPALALDRAKKELAGNARIFGEEEGDPIGIQFFEKAERMLERFEREPDSALADGEFESVLAVLEKFPLIGPDLAQAVRPGIAKAALEAVLGAERAWIHRKLEAITKESRLRRLLLRLLQASLPTYAQIRHGPIEYGKDVVVVFEQDGKRILRMYQVKAGDISTSVWRIASHEIEEMFLVRLSDFQIGLNVDAREGILLCNGHANSNVEPIIYGWIKEQERVYGRTVHFMHLDKVVKWIVDERLIGEFRASVRELDL
jgi:hypothetical protein